MGTKINNLSDKQEEVLNKSHELLFLTEISSHAKLRLN